jgi:hypothetical protein
MDYDLPVDASSVAGITGACHPAGLICANFRVVLTFCLGWL